MREAVVAGSEVRGAVGSEVRDADAVAVGSEDLGVVVGLGAVTGLGELGSAGADGALLTVDDTTGLGMEGMDLTGAGIVGTAGGGGVDARDMLGVLDTLGVLLTR